LEQEINPNLPAVVVDVPAVTHCLQNLISNAVKYGGEQRWLRVRAYRGEGEVQISVEDKGIGMESQDLQRIFDPFYRAPAVVAAQIHGTGLGLALARSMADAVGGRLTAASKPGKGSTFVLHLPAAYEHTSEEASASAGNGSPYSR
jgi:signal transduction histidine kinase